MALSPTSMMGQSPSFSSSASSSAAARSGDVTSSFMSGDFTVGGSSQSLNWLFVVAGVVLVVFFMFRGRK